MQNQIPKNWRKVKLGNIGKVITGNTPPTPQKDLFGLDYPFITPTDIKDFDVRYNYLTERFVSEKWMARKKNLSLPKNSTCFVCIGSTIGKMCLVKETSFTNQQINTIISDPTKSDPLFIYYLLKNNQKDILKEFGGGGAAKPIINKSTFEGIEVEFPEDILEQEEIASMLSAFDDKIEVNNKIAKTLEEMAHALFKEYFVERKYKNLEIKSLFEIAEVTYGYPFKSDLFNDIQNGIPVIRIRNLDGSSTSTCTTEIVEEKYKVKNGDILIGMDGEFYLRRWTGGDAYLNQRVVRLRPKKVISWFHLFLSLIKPIRDFQGSISGTTVAHLSDKDLKSIEVVISSNETYEKLSTELDNLYWLSIKSTEENIKLAGLRDLLLPKLMKGEIRI